jgi:hypothetical protein
MTVVLVAVLYYTVSGMIDRTEITPVGALGFTEHETTDGEFIGGVVSLSNKVKLKDVSLTLIDAETGTSGLINPMVNGGSAQAGDPGSEITITYDDAGKTDWLDSSDVLFITGATTGDRVVLIFLPSDDLLAQWTTPI